MASLEKLKKEVELYSKVFGRNANASYEYVRTLMDVLPRSFPEEPLEKRVKSLEKEVRELKKEAGVTRIPDKADIIYELFKAELEKEHFGKIVAIDVDSKDIVGIGNSILEAYTEARKNSTKDKFSYRKVGYDYVHRL